MCLLAAAGIGEGKRSVLAVLRNRQVNANGISVRRECCRRTTPPEEIVSISVTSRLLIALCSSSSTISQTNCLVCTDNGVRGDYDRHPTARCARAPGCHDFRGAALPWSLAAQSNKLRHTEAVVLVRPSAPAASAFSHDGGGTTPGNPLVLGWHAALPFRVTFPNE